MSQPATIQPLKINLVERAATLADAAELLATTERRLRCSAQERDHVHAECVIYVVRLLNQLADEAREHARWGVPA